MWRASLALGFEPRGERTVLATRRHEGPLVVQKPLYPEGGEVCHAIVVHPPGGIAGGDELALDVRASAGAHMLLTTPGASRWYRSSGPEAAQRVRIHAGAGGRVEWLPQETIVFDGARAAIDWEAWVEGDAALVAWEILCLGRRGSGEVFRHGSVRLNMRLVRDGRPAWIERGLIGPAGPVAESPVGLAGHTVIAAFVVSAPEIADSVLADCRGESPAGGEGAVTRWPGVLVARYRGDSSEAAKRYFVRLWSRIRPACLGREAVEPRIWRT